MKFGTSTWLWTSPFSNESLGLFRTIKELGFDCVELPIEDLAIVDGEKVKAVLDDEGLEATVCGAFGPGRDLSSDDPAVVAATLDYIKGCLDLCNEVGAEFFAGPMYAEVGKARQLPPEERLAEWNRSVENLRKVSIEAEARNLQIAIEAINRFESDMVNLTEDSLRMMRAVDHQATKVMIDTFHMTIEEASMGDAIRAAGDDLIHVQVSENHRGVTGTGLTPWGDFRDALADINYDGKVVIESFTPENRDLAGAVCIWKKFTETQDEFAAQGLQFLHSLFEHQAAEKSKSSCLVG
ncbi:sugar phosphate isomerase/epimerase family protein [Roseibacillus persicicus]|uniref:sugar phosphate isomerase/epimerase family protein n=1 Tax=Roseibacillus persicicus TaxID=454148 RepID=UPI00280CBDFE|nr:sugar phosphate isomerase/epimerase family protein [Roseibacillus persicicus]MDQ8188913.1 sugar phosphate isomerase/epimerase [Roseibacillus persicicus]